MSDDVLDFGGYPEINCASVGDMQLIGDGRVRWIMVDWYFLEGTWRRKIVATVTMPVSAVPPDHLLHWAKHFGLARQWVPSLEALN